MFRVGKFEWKIILALLLTAAAPLVFTWFMVDQLIEESLSLGLNEQVVSHLRSGVDLYKEVIESRLKIVRLKGSHLAATLEKVGWDEEALRTSLNELVQDGAWISRAEIRGPEGQIAVDSPGDYPDNAWRSRRDRFPLGGERTLEITMVIAKDFLTGSQELPEFVKTIEALKNKFPEVKVDAYQRFLLNYIWILIPAVLLGSLLARSVTTRVAKLVGATHRASAGDMTVRVVAISKDEIGQLAASFNKMMDDIQASRDRIVFLEKVSSWQEIARRLAHEIKNPLTPIQLAVQELHRSYKGDDPVFGRKLEVSLEIVEEEVATLRRMVQTFSEFAKLPEVQAEPADLSAFVADFVKRNPQYAARCDLSLSGAFLPVQLDRALMGRVLSNLIENALQASPESGRIELGTTAEDGVGLLTIADRGTGVAAEFAGRLFQPYFTTKATGTGLGLAIVKKIVLQHGGEVAFADRPEGGTVFTIRLRLDPRPHTI